jgi:hypothetical protein
MGFRHIVREAVDMRLQSPFSTNQRVVLVSFKFIRTTFIAVAVLGGSALLPLSASAAETKFSTNTGLKTLTQITSELTSSGYQGPWDQVSLLAAYDRTTQKPVSAAKSNW